MKYLTLFLCSFFFITSCQKKETCKVCEYKIDNNNWILLDVYCDDEIINTLENLSSIQYQDITAAEDDFGNLVIQVTPNTLENITGIPNIDFENLVNNLEINCQNF